MTNVRVTAQVVRSDSYDVNIIGRINTHRELTSGPADKLVDVATMTTVDVDLSEIGGTVTFLLLKTERAVDIQFNGSMDVLTVEDELLLTKTSFTQLEITNNSAEDLQVRVIMGA